MVELKVKFEVDDVELSALHSAAFGTASSHVTPWVEKLARRGLTWVGAFTAGRLVGFAQARYIDDEVFVVDAAVHPDFQGQGIGREVVEAVCGEVLKEVEQVCVTHEPHLRGFYRACGFDETGVRKR